MNVPIALIFFLLSLVFIVSTSLVSWTEWQSISKCNRKCDNEFGEMIVTRKCRICEKPHHNCKIMSNSSLCIKYLGGKNEEAKKCYDPFECYGDGIYIGQWSNWKNYSKCQIDSSKNCDGFQIQTRDCTSNRIQLKKEFNCSKYQDGFLYTRTIQCKLKCNSKRKNEKKYKLKTRSQQQIKFYCGDCEKNGGYAYLIEYNSEGTFKINYRHFVKCKDEYSCQPINKGWSDWSDWNPRECTREQMKRCSDLDTQSRSRTCLNHTSCVTCYDLKRINSKDPSDCESETRACNQKWLNEQHLCPNITGGWSDWSHWSPCSATCKNDGNGTKMRYRTCSNPPKSGLGGKDCIGESTQFESCSSTYECIYVDYFSEWSEWRANASCGPILYTRERRCQAHNISLCMGPLWAFKRDYIRCDLGRDFIENVENHLNKGISKNYLKKEGDNLVLECDTKLMDELHQKDNQINVYWIFEMKLHILDINRMTIENDDLIISYLTYEDSVWVETIEPQILLDSVSEYYLNCSDKALRKYINSSLGMKWYMNELVKKDNESDNYEKFLIAEEETGVTTYVKTDADYICIVYDRQNAKREWIMRYVKVRFNYNWIFMEYPYEFAFAFLASLALFAFCSGYFMYKAEKTHYNIEYYTKAFIQELDLKVVES